MRFGECCAPFVAMVNCPRLSWHGCPWAELLQCQPSSIVLTICPISWTKRVVVSKKVTSESYFLRCPRQIRLSEKFSCQCSPCTGPHRPLARCAVYHKFFFSCPIQTWATWLKQNKEWSLFSRSHKSILAFSSRRQLLWSPLTDWCMSFTPTGFDTLFREAFFFDVTFNLKAFLFSAWVSTTCHTCHVQDTGHRVKFFVTLQK